MGFDRSHPRWVGHVLAQAPSRRADFLQNTFAIAIGGSVTAMDLHDALFTNAVVNAQGVREKRVQPLRGLDGAEPTATEYALALGEVAALEDVSIVAAPVPRPIPMRKPSTGVLISHAEARRAYRIAVLEHAGGANARQIRTLRGLMDSTRRLVLPLGRRFEPNARAGREDIPREIALPPSGYVCGIYARNDVQRGSAQGPRERDCPPARCASKSTSTSASRSCSTPWG